MTQTFRVAVAQMEPRLGENAANLQAILERLEIAAGEGAHLVVFPECALSGYVFDRSEDALPVAETVPGASSETIAEACRRLGVYAVVGLLERAGDTLYNSALTAGPGGLLPTYRKCHLPVLGLDRFVAAGNDLPIIDLPFARLGLLICYDVRFPEAARSLALRGADVLVVPTNWPKGAESAPAFLTRARAWENRVYVVACNRIGVEKGTRFIGRSHVVSPDGKFLTMANGTADTILYAEIDPAQARQKKLVFTPGVFELDPVGGRRPELYGAVIEP